MPMQLYASRVDRVDGRAAAAVKIACPLFHDGHRFVSQASLQSREWRFADEHDSMR